MAEAADEIEALQRRAANAEETVLGQFKGIERLRAALADAIENCPCCDGNGNAYTMGDETTIGQPPGSSKTDCPNCTTWRDALMALAPSGGRE